MKPLFDPRALARWGGFAAADPFAIQVNGVWYLFFEMLIRSVKGVIAVASSRDLVDWQLLGICLEEPHHLSFPFVFTHGGAVYMIPESKSVRRVDAYRAVDFPMRWERCGTLLRGRLMDATMIEHADRFWMFSGWHSYWLRLFHADHPLGPWRPHGMPWARTYCKQNVRPAGRPFRWNGSWLRPVQDNRQEYGKQVRLMRIATLNRLWYREQPWRAEPILSPGAHAWCEHRMHHLDVHRAEDGLLAFVDGCGFWPREVARSYDSAPNLIGDECG
jgi:hypothetical protein